METATDKVPNTSATAASASSDLNGMAIMVGITIFVFIQWYSTYTEIQNSNKNFRMLVKKL